MNAVPEHMRPSRKLLRAVADLHTRGYQRLRVFVYQYELGTWRCYIAPASWFSGDHGARLLEEYSDRSARYSSADGPRYWDWHDAHHCAPSRLAEEFLRRFPELARLGYGQDWLYVGWYQHMLHLTYPDALPVAFAPHAYEMNDFMGSIGREVRIPLPPVGHGQAREPRAGVS